jgi:hypothetical protein
MPNLEQSIAEWRQQMLAAGIKSPVPLDELEGHLREEIGQRINSGYSPEQAFEMTLKQIGHAKMLKCEFEKIETTRDRRIGAITALAGLVIMLRVLIRHHETGGQWKMDQIGWMVFSGTIITFGLGPLLFNFKLGHRKVRLWKLAGIAYAVAAVWISTLPIVRLLSIPKFSVAFGTTDRILMFLAVAASLMSVLCWRALRKTLPAIQNWRTRTAIGIACSLLGPATMVAFFWFIGPLLGHFPVPSYYVMLPWMWTAMAVLGGVGYGLAEAASRETEALDSKYV